ncbi:MAG TPA: hypothetical protein VI387_05865, partial [Candidatus Brocadiales bacterium]|nr:hypothetical protein [Candidatus Brocadiales bacterium]
MITLKNWNLSACLPERDSQSGNAQAGKLIRYLFLIALVGYIFFIFTSPLVRYFYAGLAILSIIVAHFIRMIWTKYFLTRIPIILCILSISIASFSVSVRWFEGPFFAGLGVLDRIQFINECWTSLYRASLWVNENLPQDARILSTWNPGYYLNREYVLTNPAFQGVLDFGRINDTKTLFKKIKELGITHLLCNFDVPFIPYRHVGEFLKRCVLELLENGKIIMIKKIDSSTIYSVVVPS